MICSLDRDTVTSNDGEEENGDTNHYNYEKYNAARHVEEDEDTDVCDNDNGPHDDDENHGEWDHKSQRLASPYGITRRERTTVSCCLIGDGRERGQLGSFVLLRSAVEEKVYRTKQSTLKSYSRPAELRQHPTMRHSLVGQADTSPWKLDMFSTPQMSTIVCNSSPASRNSFNPLPHIMLGK